MMCKNIHVLVYVMLLYQFLYCTVFADNTTKDIEAERFVVDVNDTSISGSNKETTNLLNKLILDAGLIRSGLIANEIYYTHLIDRENLKMTQYDENSLPSSFKSNDIASYHLINQFSDVSTSENEHTIRKRDYFDHFLDRNYYNYPNHMGPSPYAIFRPPPNRIHETSPPPYQGGFHSNENNFYPPNDRFPPREFYSAHKGGEFHSRPTRDGPPERPYYEGPQNNRGPYPPPYDGAWDGPRGGPRPPPDAGPYERPPSHAGPPPPHARPPPPHAGPPPPHARPPPHRGPPPHIGTPQNRGPPNERPQYERPQQEALPYERPPSQVGPLSQGGPQYERPQPQEEPPEEIAPYETFTPPNKNINSANDENQENVNSATTAETHAMLVNNQNNPTITSLSDSQTATRPLYLVQAQAVTPEE